MNCQQIDKYIYEFCDSRLSPHMQDVIQAHLDQCENCREKAAAASQDSELLRSLDTVPSPAPEFTDRVLALVQQKHGAASAGLMAGHASRFPRPYQWWWGVASAAVLLLALCSMPLLELQAPLGSKLAEQNAADSAPAETAPLVLGHQAPQDSAAQPLLQAAAVREYTDRSHKTSLQDSAVGVTRENAPQQVSPQPAPAAQPYTSAALTKQALKSTVHNNPNRGTELLTLHPVNLPPEYALHAIISTSDEDMTFIYRNQMTQQELNLRITTLEEPAESTDQAVSEQTPMRSAAPQINDDMEEAIPPENGDPDHTYKATLNHNQYSYEMLLSGSLNNKELAALANSIQLEEGNQVVKTENP